jgi:hypothetical protein
MGARVVGRRDACRATTIRHIHTRRESRSVLQPLPARARDVRFALPELAGGGIFAGRTSIQRGVGYGGAAPVRIDGNRETPGSDAFDGMT